MSKIFVFIKLKFWRKFLLNVRKILKKNLGNFEGTFEECLEYFEKILRKIVENKLIFLQ